MCLHSSSSSFFSSYRLLRLYQQIFEWVHCSHTHIQPHKLLYYIAATESFICWITPVSKQQNKAQSKRTQNNKNNKKTTKKNQKKNKLQNKNKTKTNKQPKTIFSLFHSLNIFLLVDIWIIRSVSTHRIESCMYQSSQCVAFVAQSRRREFVRFAFTRLLIIKEKAQKSTS